MDGWNSSIGGRVVDPYYTLIVLGGVNGRGR